ncbi:phospholipase A and acyltransferase 4, partial [Pipistrellus kuhlii]
AVLLQLREEPKPGDLIEIFRTGYQHWALYVGDGYVIHLAAPDGFSGAGSSSVLSVLGSKGIVKKQRLKDVVGGCRYRVNNHLDQQYSPLPVNKIIRSAEEMVGKALEYDVLKKNCEHFVTDLRYGNPRSKQAENFQTKAVVGGATLMGGALAFAGYTFMSKRFQRQ